MNLNLVRLSLDNNNIHSLMNGIFEGVNIKENTGEIDLSDNPIVEIYEDSIQDILCDTARFVLSTDGTSACACNSTTRSIFCSCRGGSAGSSNSTVGPPTACKIPIITSIGVSCNPSQEDNGCDRTEEDTAISGPFSSTLQDEVIAFSEMVGNNIEHVAPSTEGSDFLILTFDSSAFLRTSSSEYVSAGNAFLKVENRKGEACVLSENHLKCGTNIIHTQDPPPYHSLLNSLSQTLYTHTLLLFRNTRRRGNDFVTLSDRGVHDFVRNECYV